MSDAEPQAAADHGVDIHLVVTGQTARIVDGPSLKDIGVPQTDAPSSPQGLQMGVPQPDLRPVHIHLYCCQPNTGVTQADAPSNPQEPPMGVPQPDLRPVHIHLYCDQKTTGAPQAD